jgi:SNF2 family DNA or RNA helicase
MEGLDLTPQEVKWLQSETCFEFPQKAKLESTFEMSTKRSSSGLTSSIKKSKKSFLDECPFMSKEEIGFQRKMDAENRNLENAVPVGSLTIQAENLTLKGASDEIQAGDIIQIYSSIPMSFKKALKPSARIRSKSGKDIGRIFRDSSDTPSFLVTLLESGIAAVKAEVVYVPLLFKTLSEILLSVTIYLLPEAFSPLKTCIGADELFDSELKKKKIMLVELFQRMELLDSAKAKKTIAAHKTDSSYALESDDSIRSNDIVQIYSKSESIGMGLLGMKPAKGMTLTLRDYQESGLSFMYSKETNSLECNGISPLWEKITPTGSQTSFFYNPYSGELSLQAPRERMTLGGILADEMVL